MGARGPKPTPTNVLKARGTLRPGRAALNEVQPTGKPRCPKWLSKDAAKEFKRIVKLLDEQGLLGAVDENALVRYATTWVRWRQAIGMIEKGGEVQVFKDADGKVKAIQPGPFNAIARGLSEELSRIEQSFGMNPSSRSRINVATPQAPATTEDTDRFFGPRLAAS